MRKKLGEKFGVVFSLTVVVTDTELVNMADEGSFGWSHINSETLYCGLFRDLVPRFYDDLYVSRLVSFLSIAVLWRKGVFVVRTRPFGGFLLFFLFWPVAGFSFIIP